VTRDRRKLGLKRSPAVKPIQRARRGTAARQGGRDKRRDPVRRSRALAPAARGGRSHSARDSLRATERRLALALLAWFASAQRQLPWRETYDPYTIWIAEMMLQQTQVDTVRPYYRRWMERFPSVAAVARAPLEAVLKAWEGLGYYGRARNLHRTAQALVERHGGSLPDDLAALRALPGIGPYTAGAIASIAFNRAVPLVDSNVARVLGRLHADRSEAASPAARMAAWAAAERLLAAACDEGGQPREFNQALMELGALVCRPRAPQCLICPWQADCRARLTGDPEAFPLRRARRLRPVRHGVMLIAQASAPSGSRIWLMRRRPPRGVWGGLWEFPWAEPRSHQESSESVCMTLLAEFGQIRPRSVRSSFLGHVSHSLTHFQLELDCLVLTWPDARASWTAEPARAADPDSTAKPDGTVRWLNWAELEALPLARLSHKALALLDR